MRSSEGVGEAVSWTRRWTLSQHLRGPRQTRQLKAGALSCHLLIPRAEPTTWNTSTMRTSRDSRPPRKWERNLYLKAKLRTKLTTRNFIITWSSWTRMRKSSKRKKSDKGRHESRIWREESLMITIEIFWRSRNSTVGKPRFLRLCLSLERRSRILGQPSPPISNLRTEARASSRTPKWKHRSTQQLNLRSQNQRKNKGSSLWDKPKPSNPPLSTKWSTKRRISAKQRCQAFKYRLRPKLSRFRRRIQGSR